MFALVITLLCLINVIQGIILFYATHNTIQRVYYNEELLERYLQLGMAILV